MADQTHQTGEVILRRYRIDEFVAEGSMQKVYRATDLSINRLVALKVPKISSARKRFRRSAEMSARVTHSNVAKTLDFLPTGDTEYLVEEYINGTNLQDRLDLEFFRLDPHLAAHLIHHVAKGVSASHRAGVVHRDLKPSNIMVSDDPGLTEIKITDFGVSKMAAAEIDEAIEEGEESISASATAVGALPYMAPEVIRNNRQVGLASDIWAVGAILYHVLTGSRPFGRGLAAIPSILNGTFAPVGAHLEPKPQFKELIAELERIVDACLVVDPANRIGSEDLVAAISKVCYSTAPRYVGLIYNYGVGTGSWGFISSRDVGDCFFHADSYYGKNPRDGQRVNFARFPGQPDARAFPVLPLKEIGSAQ